MTTASRRPVLAVTCGEPAGIGPEIALRAAWATRDVARSILIGDAALLSQVAYELGQEIRISAISPLAVENSGLPDFPADRLTVLDCQVNEPVVPGTLDVRNGKSMLKMLDMAIDGTMQGRFDAIVTGPLQKSIINEAGIAFTGHTEYLAQRTGTGQVVMMLAGGDDPHLRVALATTHLPLKDVSAAITKDGLAQTLGIIHADLQSKFGIASPRILVTGLNPHAGEDGHMGREEIDVIAPVIAAARDAGMQVTGPYPADTLFQKKYLSQADCVLAMYHDQGLPVLKFASFGSGVNITLGLPLIRTSVDHGTALDLAAKGVGHADHGSMVQAIRIAADMVQRRS